MRNPSEEGWCMCMQPPSILKASSISITNLLGSHSPYLLRANMHMLVQIHVQVVLPHSGLHGEMNQ